MEIRWFCWNLSEKSPLPPGEKIKRVKCFPDSLDLCCSQDVTLEDGKGIL